VTPVPLELPLRPAEAADLANLIFDHAGTVTNLSGREGFSRYAVAIPATASCLSEAEMVYHQIRRVRAAMKISRGFDLELDAANPLTPEFLRSALDFIMERGHLPQLVCPGPVAEKDLDEMAATAQHFQITLSFRYRAEPAETVRAIAKAMAGRLNYRVRNAAEAEFVAEHLL
jgi:threonine dehydrogenase-like Zn-dependent dehydrogenase